jgi:hypothetical protein
MDDTGAKPAQEPKDVPTMMKEMMETMCCSGEVSPADMCRRMRQAMGRRSDAKAQSAPGSGAPSDGSGRGGGEAPRSCCGPQLRRTPKRP